MRRWGAVDQEDVSAAADGKSYPVQGAGELRLLPRAWLSERTEAEGSVGSTPDCSSTVHQASNTPEPVILFCSGKCPETQVATISSFVSLDFQLPLAR